MSNLIHQKVARAGVAVSLALGIFLCGTAAFADFAITSATLTGPGKINKGAKATFTWVIKGKDAGKILGTSLLWSVFDQDGGSDDLLIDETRFVVTDDQNGDFTFTRDFELECTTDCHIKGKSGQTDDKAPPDAQVYVLFETSLTGSDVGKTNVLDVVCVPEPGIAPFAGVCGVFLLSALWRRNRSRS